MQPINSMSRFSATDYRVSFEVLHLFYLVSNRLEKALTMSELNPKRAYILTYIFTRGVEGKSFSGRTVRLVSRARMLEIMQEVFGCSEDQARREFKELSVERLISSRD